MGITPSQKRKIRKFFSPVQRIGLQRKTFSIISNNCWGGITYDKLGLQYLSPTIGMLFKPHDFLKFITNLDFYLSLSPTPRKNGKFKTTADGKNNNLFEAELGDISLFFIHYKTIDEAIVKWEKRKRRVNKNALFIKWSDSIVDGQGVSEEDLQTFSQLPYAKVFFTTNKEWSQKYAFARYFPKKGLDGNIFNEFKQANKVFSMKDFKKIINKI